MKTVIRRLGAIAAALALLISTASALSVEQAVELLEQRYLRDMPAAAYQAETLDALFEALGDPYTYYMSAEEYQAFLDSVEDTVSLVGIGVSIQYTDQGILVLEALKGGSALAAGLQAGDVIVAVDGVSCAPAGESHRALILGEEGTQVTVTVMRGEQTLNYTITRAPVVVPNTETSVVDGHIGYVDCDSFGQDTGALVLSGVETYNESVDCWLVDLRGNSGGYTTAAVDAIGVFAGAGPHLYLRDSAGLLYYYQYGENAATDRPCVVLVNGSTASAAEAFAAGMRDLRRSITVGSRTFGKGVAQVVFDQENCPEYFAGDAMKVTAYRFYSAGGNTNDIMGVIPTLLVADEDAQAVALAVCGAPNATEESLMVIEVGGFTLPVDLAAVSGDTLSALFEALQPGAVVTLWESGQGSAYTAPEAAALLGVTYDSRWFDDVETDEYAKEINTLATYGILIGNGGGKFCPAESLKRGELCAMLANVLNLSGGGEQRFSDVESGAWYADAVNAMAEMGMVQGAGDGRFYPNEPLTQEEYAAVLSRVACYLSVNLNFAADQLTQEQLDAMAELGFRDWACPGAALLDYAGVLFASAQELQPQAPVLRSQAAASLYGVLVVAGILPQ